MQAIRRKLNSQRGASMLMALLLMLVGIMVSAVIISAATSAAVNKRSEKEQQQAYLARSALPPSSCATISKALRAGIKMLRPR